MHPVNPFTDPPASTRAHANDLRGELGMVLDRLDALLEHAADLRARRDWLRRALRQAERELATPVANPSEAAP